MLMVICEAVKQKSHDKVYIENEVAFCKM